MGFGIFGNTSSKQQTPLSWTSGSFPGAPPAAVHFITSPGYSYASYSPVPTVWPVQQQQQQFVAVSPYPVQMPLQVPVQVQQVPVAQQMTVVSPTTTYTQSPTLVMQQQTVTTTPGPNTLLLREVPSPKISHIIPHRSPRVQPQPVLVQEYRSVPVQQQQQEVVYSQQLLPQQQQQQQQQSPIPSITLNLYTTPLQGQAPLPRSSPRPAPPPQLHESVPPHFSHDDPSGSAGYHGGQQGDV